ncbi:methyltransferase domain-containing protein [Candidatus Roizmanbacteria bacterium]|nr:methyltransferase domain-containing protein [Candidatus Roizmanbacteria bacterium]
MKQTAKRQLFLISFLILFAELVFIRFIPAQIRYVGYFSNIILLASFVGIGLGASFWQRLRFPAILMPLTIVGFEFILYLFKYDLVIASDQVIYFGMNRGSFSAEPIFLLPVIFFLTAFIFVLPAAVMGRLFQNGPPLQTYKINILGSLTGIAAFTALSFVHAGPFIWFPLLLLLSLFFLPAANKKTVLLGVAIVLFSFVFEMANFSSPQYRVLTWSPYYKITLTDLALPAKNVGYTLNVNNIGHQIMIDPNDRQADIFYQFPYRLMKNRVYKNVLVIGAGGGNDVTQALRKGAERVVAVDIDPTIIDLGKRFHPNRPYSSPKVQTVVADGRDYLQNSREKFDLIIFALTDSLTLTSSASSLRLESYLFTQESIRQARRLLKKDGTLVLYNYYRTPWIVDKLSSLVKREFRQDPLVIMQTDRNLNPAIIMVFADRSPPLPKLPADLPPVPTDDWPFLYLQNREIPSLYLSYLSIIVLAVIIIILLLRQKSKSGFAWGLFFLGAAFMLLETKNVVQFTLLFGSTWLTNAFVFMGLLTLVLIAIIIAERSVKVSIPLLFIFLCLSLIFTYFFPQSTLLRLPYLLRLIPAVIINFLPVFIANVIFSLLFKHSKIPAEAYGANILGSFIGGIFEYSSLIFGYRNLTLFILVFYLLFFAVYRKRAMN